MRVTDIQQILTGLIGQLGKNEKELVPGSVITAFLKEIKGNMALLNYLGTDFVARLETDAPAGERLRFFVEGKKEGQTVLKLLGNEKESNQLVLSGIVKDLGISDEPVNLKIVGEMLRQKMPLDPDIAGRISTFIRSLNIPEHHMWIPVFMHKNQVPLSPQNYRQVSALVNDIQYLQQDIINLTDEIAKLAAGPKTETSQLAASVGKLLAQFKLNPEEGSFNTVHKLSTIFRMLMPATSGVSTPKSMAMDTAGSQAVHVFPAESGSPPAQVTPSAANSPAIPEVDAKISSEATKLAEIPNKTLSQTSGDPLIVSGLAEDVVVSHNGRPSDPNPDGHTGESGEPFSDLDSLLHKLTVALRENSKPEHKEVLKLIQDVSEKLDFIRNFNSHSESGRENMIVMYSSVKFDENQAPFRLLVKYQQENRKKVGNFKACRMEIRLNTPGLGPVKCEVQVMEKNLTIQFGGTSESAASFIDRFTGILANRLGDLKFNVNLLPTKTSVEKENDFLSYETNDIPGLFQLNLKI